MSTKLKAGTATSGAVIDADTTGILELQSGSTPTTAVTIDASQNVGIGTSSPSYKLQVNGSYIYSSGINAGFLSQDTSGGSWAVGASAGNYVINQSSVAERMRIDSSGNLLVGATTTVLGARQYIVGTSTNYVQALNAIGSGTYFLSAFKAGGTDVGSITSNGTTTAYNVTSDRRTKENIKPFTKGLDTITLLKPSEFNYILDKENIYQGFIADELQSVVPNAVTGEIDGVDAEGKPVYQGVDVSFLIPHLVSAIQELNVKVDAQAAEIQALKGVA